MEEMASVMTASGNPALRIGAMVVGGAIIAGAIGYGVYRWWNKTPAAATAEAPKDAAGASA